MYKYNRVGPWPQFDINNTVLSGQSAPIFGATRGVLKPHLVVGSGDKGNISGWDNPAETIPAQNSYSKAIVLDNVEKHNIDINYMLEYTMTVDCPLTPDVYIFGWVGLLDTGWQAGPSADNYVRRYKVLPMFSMFSGVHAQGQTLIRNLTSDSINTVDNIAIGYTMWNTTDQAAPIDNQVMISCNLAVTEVDTYDKLR